MKREKWSVWWKNPDTGKWEIYQSGLSRARADRLADTVTYVLSPRWGYNNVPTKVEPDLQAAESPMRRRKYGKRNPLTSKEDLLIAGLGVAIAGGIGYLLYTTSQSNALAASSGGGGVAGGGTNQQGVFSNTNPNGPVGPASSGYGTQVFDPNSAPGPIGPNTYGPSNPVGPIGP